jgi:hypothetical protein
VSRCALGLEHITPLHAHQAGTVNDSPAARKSCVSRRCVYRLDKARMGIRCGAIGWWSVWDRRELGRFGKVNEGISVGPDLLEIDQR